MDMPYVLTDTNLTGPQLSVYRPTCIVQLKSIELLLNNNRPVCSISTTGGGGYLGKVDIFYCTGALLLYWSFWPTGGGRDPPPSGYGPE